VSNSFCNPDFGLSGTVDALHGQAANSSVDEIAPRAAVTARNNGLLADLWRKFGGLDVGKVRTRAEKRDDRWVLNGSKLWTTSGPNAGFVAGSTIMGAVADRGWCRSMPRLLIAVPAAAALVFLTGLAWLAASWMPSVPATIAARLTPLLIGSAATLAFGFARPVGLRRRASPCP